MYNDQIITEKQHQQWFKNVNSSKTEHYFIFTIDHTDTGFVSFKDVDHKNNHCYWGFTSERPRVQKAPVLSWDF